MDRSPLAKLPREVRDEIYRITLHSDRAGDIEIDLTRSGKPKGDEPKLRIYGSKLHAVLQALTTTCKQARQEMMQTFFEINTFAFRTTILNNAAYWPDSVKSINELPSLRHWIQRMVTRYPDLRLRLHIQMGRMFTKKLMPESVFRQWIVGEIVRTVKVAHSGSTIWTLSLRVLPDFERQMPFRESEATNWPPAHQPSFVEYVRIPLMSPDSSIKQSLENGKDLDSNYRISKSNGPEFQAEYLDNLARMGQLVKIFVDDIRKGVGEDEWVDKAI